VAPGRSSGIPSGAPPRGWATLLVRRCSMGRLLISRPPGPLKPQLRADQLNLVGLILALVLLLLTLAMAPEAGWEVQPWAKRLGFGHAAAAGLEAPAARLLKAACVAGIPGHGSDRHWGPARGSGGLDWRQSPSMAQALLPAVASPKNCCFRGWHLGSLNSKLKAAAARPAGFRRGGDLP